MRTLAEKIYRRLIQGGLSPVAAAAAVGHGQAESALNTTASGDDGTAYGIWQWREDRKRGLKKFAGGADNMSDWEKQVDYFLHELETTEKRAGRKLKAAKTIEEANDAMVHFERPQGYKKDGTFDKTTLIAYDKRLGASKRALQRFENINRGTKENPYIETVKTKTVPLVGSSEADLKFAHAGQEGLAEDFASMLRKTGGAVGRDLPIQSGYRAPKYNRNVGGRKASYHMKRIAADINLSGMTDAQKAELVHTLVEHGAKRLITYDKSENLLHVDMGDAYFDQEVKGYRTAEDIAAGKPLFMHNSSRHQLRRAPKWFQDIHDGKSPYSAAYAPAEDGRIDFPDIAKQDLASVITPEAEKPDPSLVLNSPFFSSRASKPQGQDPLQTQLDMAPRSSPGDNVSLAGVPEPEPSYYPDAQTSTSAELAAQPELSAPGENYLPVPVQRPETPEPQLADAFVPTPTPRPEATTPVDVSGLPVPIARPVSPLDADQVPVPEFAQHRTATPVPEPRPSFEVPLPEPLSEPGTLAADFVTASAEPKTRTVEQVFKRTSGFPTQKAGFLKDMEVPALNQFHETPIEQLELPTKFVDAQPSDASPTLSDAFLGRTPLAQQKPEFVNTTAPTQTVMSGGPPWDAPVTRVSQTGGAQALFSPELSPGAQPLDTSAAGGGDALSGLVGVFSSLLGAIAKGKQQQQPNLPPEQKPVDGLLPAPEIREAPRTVDPSLQSPLLPKADEEPLGDVFSKLRLRQLLGSEDERRAGFFRR